MEETINDIRWGGRVLVGVNTVEVKRKQSFSFEIFNFEIIVFIRSVVTEFRTEADQRRESLEFLLRAVAEQMVEKNFSLSILPDSKCP